VNLRKLAKIKNCLFGAILESEITKKRKKLWIVLRFLNFEICSASNFSHIISWKCSKGSCPLWCSNKPAIITLLHHKNNISFSKLNFVIILWSIIVQGSKSFEIKTINKQFLKAVYSVWTYGIGLEWSCIELDEYWKWFWDKEELGRVYKLFLIKIVYFEASNYCMMCSIQVMFSFCFSVIFKKTVLLLTLHNWTHF